jgi:hypothetical protein
MLPVVMAIIRRLWAVLPLHFNRLELCQLAVAVEELTQFQTGEMEVLVAVVQPIQIQLLGRVIRLAPLHHKAIVVVLA